jgi:hypothetical protein
MQVWTKTFQKNLAVEKRFPTEKKNGTTSLTTSARKKWDSATEAYLIDSRHFEKLERQAYNLLINAFLGGRSHKSQNRSPSTNPMRLHTWQPTASQGSSARSSIAALTAMNPADKLARLASDLLSFVCLVQGSQSFEDYSKKLDHRTFPLDPSPRTGIKSRNADTATIPVDAIMASTLIAGSNECFEPFIQQLTTTAWQRHHQRHAASMQALDPRPVQNVQVNTLLPVTAPGRGQEDIKKAPAPGTGRDSAGEHGPCSTHQGQSHTRTACPLCLFIEGEPANHSRRFCTVPRRLKELQRLKSNRDQGGSQHRGEPDNFDSTTAGRTTVTRTPWI